MIRSNKCMSTILVSHLDTWPRASIRSVAFTTWLKKLQKLRRVTMFIQDHALSTWVSTGWNGIDSAEVLADIHLESASAAVLITRAPPLPNITGQIMMTASSIMNPKRPNKKIELGIRLHLRNLTNFTSRSASLALNTKELFIWETSHTLLSTHHWKSMSTYSWSAILTRRNNSWKVWKLEAMISNITSTKSSP